MGHGTTEPQIVNGRNYRWNFDHHELQLLRSGESYWDRSAFTGFVKDALLGKPLRGLESDMTSAKNLIQAFVPIIHKFYNA